MGSAFADRLTTRGQRSRGAEVTAGANDEPVAAARQGKQQQCLGIRSLKGRGRRVCVGGGQWGVDNWLAAH